MNVFVESSLSDFSFIVMPSRIRKARKKLKTDMAVVKLCENPNITQDRIIRIDDCSLNFGEIISVKEKIAK